MRQRLAQFLKQADGDQKDDKNEDTRQSNVSHAGTFE